jgi:hypothetical protein
MSQKEGHLCVNHTIPSASAPVLACFLWIQPQADVISITDSVAVRPFSATAPAGKSPPWISLPTDETLGHVAALIQTTELRNENSRNLY